MKIVNTVELKNHTNEILRQVRRGRPVAVTVHGKPQAAIVPLRGNGLEELMFEYSPVLRRLIEEAEADIKAGRVVAWDTFLAHERRQAA